MKVCVRFAPSPTGIPHIGNIRTALFDYFFAKNNQGKFILRIEDTDQTRKVEGAEEAIKESLLWLGAEWDEYVVQSTRLAEYKRLAQELLLKDLAKEEEGAIRFIVPKEGKTSWVDKVGNKKIEFDNREIEDFIILKKDGFPTYHLANVIDDHFMGVTHVIRGEDWISSTPKHVMLYKALGWEDSIPFFVHVPNIKEKGGKKLSKRSGAKSVLDFKREGYLPEALLNYLMLLGWSPKEDREILSKEEIEKDFKLENINVAPAIFDPQKLLWMNGMYIREKTNEELLMLLKDYYDDGDVVKVLESSFINGLIELAKTRMGMLSDFKSLVLKEHYEKSKEERELASFLSEELKSLAIWKKEEIFSIFKKIMDDKNVKMPVFYKIFTGRNFGLPLPEFLEALGREESISRLK